MAEKITYYLLVLLLIILGFGQLLRFSLNGIPIYPHDLIVLLILIFNILSLSKIHIPKSVKFFLVSILIGWIYAFFTYKLTDLLTPFLYTIRLLVYLTFALLTNRLKHKLPLFLFLVSGGISMILGLAQYLLSPDMRIFEYLGWDDHLNRITLPHFDPTFSSVMFTLSGILAYEHRKYWYSLLALPSILLSYARSTWLSIGLVAVTKIKLKYITLLIAILIIPFLVLPKKAGEGNNLLRTYSISSRLSHDLMLIKKVNFGMITGVGYNTLPLIIEKAKVYDNHVSGANNSYLQLLLTTGVLGLVSTISSLSHLLKRYKSKLSLTFVLIASLFNNVLLYPFVMLWLILLPMHYNTKNVQKEVKDQ